MLDASSSLKDRADFIKVSATVFLALLMPDDEFGIVLFSDVAKWIYPNQAPVPQNISDTLMEITEAANVIEKEYRADGWTNIGAAFQAGNFMKDKMTKDPVFVLVCQGMHNVGANPENVLGDEPPIQIFNIGKYAYPEYFGKLTDKNMSSRYCHTPEFGSLMSSFYNLRSHFAGDDFLFQRVENREFDGKTKFFSDSFVNNIAGSSLRICVACDSTDIIFTNAEERKINAKILLYDPNNNLIMGKWVAGERNCQILSVPEAVNGRWVLMRKYLMSKRIKICETIVVFNGFNEKKGEKLWDY